MWSGQPTTDIQLSCVSRLNWVTYQSDFTEVVGYCEGIGLRTFKTDVQHYVEAEKFFDHVESMSTHWGNDRRKSAAVVIVAFVWVTDRLAT